MSIHARRVSKRFGNFVALDDVDLEVPTGELVALLGPSGCGKTTLLRIIAGLESADRGEVLFHGDDATDLSARERRVGFVFQHYALFRHMSVFENVAFGLRVRPRRERPSEEAIADKVHSLLKLVQLDWLADRYPSQLSGGQRQRIALARALAVEPRVLLLDEPFGALDAMVRKDLRRWLRRLHDELHVTSVFVTHDQEEALEVADRVVLMNHGRIEQVGAPEEVYAHPASAFVYGFLGSANRFHGHAAEGAFRGEGLHAPVDAATEGQAVAYARPHELELAPWGAEQAGIEARVLRRFVRGSRILVEAARETDGEIVEVELAREDYEALSLTQGSRVRIQPRHLRVFAHTDTAARRAA